MAVVLFFALRKNTEDERDVSIMVPLGKLSAEMPVTSEEHRTAVLAMLRAMTEAQRRLCLMLTHESAVEEVERLAGRDLDSSVRLCLDATGYHAIWFWRTASELACRIAPESRRAEVEVGQRQGMDLFLNNRKSIDGDVRTEIISCLVDAFTPSRLDAVRCSSSVALSSDHRIAPPRRPHGLSQVEHTAHPGI